MGVSPISKLSVTLSITSSIASSVECPFLNPYCKCYSTKERKCKKPHLIN